MRFQMFSMHFDDSKIWQQLTLDLTRDLNYRNYCNATWRPLSFVPLNKISWKYSRSSLVHSYAIRFTFFISAKLLMSSGSNIVAATSLDTFPQFFFLCVHVITSKFFSLRGHHFNTRLYFEYEEYTYIFICNNAAYTCLHFPPFPALQEQ